MTSPPESTSPPAATTSPQHRIANIREAFLTFDWKGTGLEEEFSANGWDRFSPITYQDQWKVIRTIQKFNGVTYTEEGLKGLKKK